MWRQETKERTLIKHALLTFSQKSTHKSREISIVLDTLSLYDSTGYGYLQSGTPTVLRTVGVHTGRALAFVGVVKIY